jgi:hypothetical protein
LLGTSAGAEQAYRWLIFDHPFLPSAWPEVDRAEWFDLEAALSKILSGQIEFIDRLEKEVK